MELIFSIMCCYLVGPEIAGANGRSWIHSHVGQCYWVFCIRTYLVATGSSSINELAPYYMGFKHNWRNASVLYISAQFFRENRRDVMYVCNIKFILQSFLCHYEP